MKSRISNQWDFRVGGATRQYVDLINRISCRLGHKCCDVIFNECLWVLQYLGQDLWNKVCFKTLCPRFSLYMWRSHHLLFPVKVGGGFALGFPWQHRAQWTHSWEEMCWPVSPHYDPLLAKHKHLSLYIGTCGSWLPISEESHESQKKHLSTFNWS